MFTLHLQAQIHAQFSDYIENLVREYMRNCFPTKDWDLIPQVGYAKAGDNLNARETDLESPYLSSVWPVCVVGSIP